MFQFAHPWFLLLLVLIPVIIRAWLRRRRASVRFSDTALVSGVPAQRGRHVEHYGALARAIALSAFVAAIAGPRVADWRTRIPTEGIAIMMVIDVSGSMATRDFNWRGQSISRLDAAKRAFQLFLMGGHGPNGERLDGRPTDLVGLVTFAQRPECRCPLTLSHAVLMRLLDDEQPRAIPGDSETNISDAIVLALHRLDAVGARRKVMIVLSDGEHNVPEPRSEWTPRQAGQLAANLQTPIYTIDAGSDEAAANDDAPPEGPTRASVRGSAISTLRSIAKLTSGKAFQAPDIRGLFTVYQEIDRLEKSAIQSFQYLRYYEGYLWLGLLALGTWLGICVVENTVWLRIP